MGKEETESRKPEGIAAVINESAHCAKIVLFLICAIAVTKAVPTMELAQA